MTKWQRSNLLPTKGFGQHSLRNCSTPRSLGPLLRTFSHHPPASSSISPSISVPSHENVHWLSSPESLLFDPTALWHFSKKENDNLTFSPLLQSGLGFPILQGPWFRTFQGHSRSLLFLNSPSVAADIVYLLKHPSFGLFHTSAWSSSLPLHFLAFFSSEHPYMLIFTGTLSTQQGWPLNH